MTAVNLTGSTSEPFGGWLSQYHWAPATLTYSFPANGSFYSYMETSSVYALADSQKNTIRDALAQIESFTQLQFFEVSETFSNEATLRYASEVGLVGGLGYFPQDIEQGGDAFFGTGSAGPAPGNEAFVIIVHEIGHTLGLAHGHEDNSFAGSSLNSQEYTLMTYADYVGDTDINSFDSGPVDWAQSFMQLDIAALQFLYGANYSSSGEVWSGDTVYMFDPLTGEMSIDGAGQGAPAGNRIFRTIWDGNGTDTYDLSNYATDLKIDLAPGAWSLFSDAQLADLNSKSPDPQYLAEGNVANARLVGGDYRAMIENATGGRGNDVIAGNAVANLLKGQRGDDDLSGLAGDDTLVGGNGRDTLRGGADNDTLKGGKARDTLLGEDGGDVLKGGGAKDTLKGGKGTDTLIGGAGFDRLFGGAGRDDFVYNSASDAGIGSDIERIRKFVVGKDDIDFSALTGAPLDLVLNGNLTGTSASVATRNEAADTRVRVDLDGDGTADMQILIVGVQGLGAGEFIL